MPPRIAVREIAFFERPVKFTRPFRFGAVVIDAAPQVFVRVEIEIEGKGRAVGASAEMLVPKWFDKRPQLSPDVRNQDIAQFLARCHRLDRVAIRHTVGLDDQIEGNGGVADPHENSAARYFKLKLNGDPEADAARLIRIGNELATLPHDYAVTLDANEQYADLAALGALVDRLDRDSALKPIAAKLLYIEQPMPREIFRQSPLGALGQRGRFW